MFLDRDTLHTNLFGLVGFHNPNNPNYPNLLPSLLESRSSQYVNDVHSLIQIENIDQSIKNFSHYNYPTYSAVADAAGDYTTGSKVTFNQLNYEYINATASSGNAPPDVTYWRQIDELSDYLIKAVYNGMDRMLDAYMGKKKLATRIKSIFNDVLLYNGIANYREVEVNNDKFVGLRIRLRKEERHLVVILNKIGHQFNASFTGLTLRLYHDSQQTAIASFNIDHAQGNSSQWTSLTTDNILRYVDDYDAGGDFYIGYKQSDLEAESASALNKDVIWNEKPCDCDNKWSTYYKQYSKYIHVMGFEVLETEMPGDVMFDPTKATYTNTKNYGLNLSMTTKCDLSPFILQEELILAEPLKYHVGLVLLEAMAANTRGGNQVANQVKKEAERQLYNHREARGTVFDRAVDAIESLDFDLSAMGNACVPEDNKHKLNIRRRAI